MGKLYDQLALKLLPGKKTLLQSESVDPARPQPHIIS